MLWQVTHHKKQIALLQCGCLLAHTHTHTHTQMQTLAYLLTHTDTKQEQSSQTHFSRCCPSSASTDVAFAVTGLNANSWWQTWTFSTLQDEEDYLNTHISLGLCEVDELQIQPSGLQSWGLSIPRLISTSLHFTSLFSLTLCSCQPFPV